MVFLMSCSYCIQIFTKSVENVKICKVKNTTINSERSEECIDFTMIVTSRNNAPISNYGGGFRCKSEYPWCTIEFSKKSRKTKIKMTGKREFLRKTSFRPNRFFFYGCNSKTNHCKYLKFSPNVYVSVIYIQLNLQNILTFLIQILTTICLNHEYLQIIFLAYINYKRTYILVYSGHYNISHLFH
ncbi:Uncharacterized protein FWK35_00012407 [Aphis craccivora]|uniref:Uncharacterized protein n=1 Tax=Aphis craccivora TaxID=307492 RepID=A0A6G0YTG2_APHCR|nr:Uncharacterized protein FWK35_00012407 [Aphis craccivora]